MQDPPDGVVPRYQRTFGERVRGQYKKRWPSAPIPVPTANTVNGYIAVRSSCERIERAGKDDVTAVIKALKDIRRPTPQE
jgi:hypothetical protein